MPVADRFLSAFVRIDGGELRKRDGHLSILPFDLHEHVAFASFFLCHVAHFDDLSPPQSRFRFNQNSTGLVYAKNYQSNDHAK